MDKRFYLVRSEKCYKDNPQPRGYSNPSWTRQDNFDDAKQLAMVEATRFQRKMCVYELRLVGVAEPPKAVWTMAEDL